MLRVCAWCGKNMGEKPPLEDKSVTHGICKECARKEAEPVGGVMVNEDRMRTKYMTFVKVGQKPKTSEWHVVNNESGFVLGSIHWYGAWRQYVLDTNECTFNNGCLDTISQFLTKLNNEQKGLANSHEGEGKCLTLKGLS